MSSERQLKPLPTIHRRSADLDRIPLKSQSQQLRSHGAADVGPGRRDNAGLFHADRLLAEENRLLGAQRVQVRMGHVERHIALDVDRHGR